MTPFDIRCWELLGIKEVKENPIFMDSIKKSHKFLIHNEISEEFLYFSDDLIQNGLFRLPFDKIILEFRNNDNSSDIARIVMIAEEIGKYIIVFPYVRYVNKDWAGGINYSLYLDKEEIIWKISKNFEDTENVDLYNQQQIIVDGFSTAVAALISNKFPSVEIPVSSKLIKSRKNKLPLFVYKVLEIKEFGSNRKIPNGTHASPALHWRRGHIRNIGRKIVSVSPCMVGSSENGVVVKDYVMNEKGRIKLC